MNTYSINAEIRELQESYPEAFKEDSPRFEDDLQSLGFGNHHPMLWNAAFDTALYQLEREHLATRQPQN